VSDDELVLVVPRGAVIEGTGWQGIRGADLEAVLATVAKEGSHRRRGDMERDPSYKQVIPYLVLRDGDRYFLMRRTRAGGDSRLHDSWSIGVGGHLNPEDGGPLEGLDREWAEEIEADFIPTMRFVGLLNDDETDVGRVHIGLVFVGDAMGRPTRIRETDKLEGHFAVASEVAAVADRLESWSRLVFQHLAPKAGL
jgi:predicted NUDIX family phosphoesterase